jgi:hypothetical protein
MDIYVLVYFYSVIVFCVGRGLATR